MSELVLYPGGWEELNECVVRVDLSSTSRLTAHPDDWGDLSASTIALHGDVTAPEGVARLDLATLKPLPAELLQLLRAGSAPAVEPQAAEASEAAERRPDDLSSDTEA